MVNLLEETLHALKYNGKTPKDVLWVGDQYKKTTWENFEIISNFEYDSGYGCSEIESSLIIVGDTWWLEREDYDGSEWWEFKEHPKCESNRNSLLLSVLEDWSNGLTWWNEDED